MDNATAATFYKHHPLPSSALLETGSAELYNAAHMNTLTNDERAALQEYKGSGFSVMNRMLQSGQYPLVRFTPLVKALAKELANGKAKKATRPVWEQEHEQEQRLLRTYLDQANGTIALTKTLDDVFAKRRKLAINKYIATHKVGDLVAFPEYLSTTLHTRVAWGYNYTVNDGAMFVFNIKKQHMPWILLTYNMLASDSADDGNDMQNEYEVVLPRGTRWRVTKVYKTSMHPAEAAVCQFVGITPQAAVQRTREHPITVYEMESLPHPTPRPIVPLEHAPYELLVVPQDPQLLATS